MSSNDLRKTAEKVLEMTRSKGIPSSEVIAEKGRSFSVSVQQGKIDKYKVSSASIIGLRVIKDQRAGLAYSESFEEASLQLMVEQALENSKYTAIDEHQAIDTKEPQTLIEDKPEIYQADNATIDEKMNLALRLERELLAADSSIINSPYNGYADGESEMVYMNHHHTLRSHRERSYQCYVAGLARKDPKQAMFGCASNSRRFEDLNPQFCIEETVRHIIPLLDAKPIKTGRYDLVFETDEWSQFLGCFLSVFSAKEVLDGKSGLRDRLGEQIFSDKLTFHDEPQYRKGFYYSQFDDEGHVRRPLLFVERGILKSYFHNSTTARRMKVQPTGHGARSAKSALGVSSTQIVIEAGLDAESDLLNHDHFRIIGLKGLHSGTNAVSGHFSLAAEGIFYRQGQVGQYVKDVTISGNFFELMKQVGGVGHQERGNHAKTFFSPYILFQGVSVAGI